MNVNMIKIQNLSSFTNLRDEVIKAKEEAEDNFKYLSTLRK